MKYSPSSSLSLGNFVEIKAVSSLELSFFVSLNVVSLICKWRSILNVSRLSLISRLDGLVFIILRLIVSMASSNGRRWALRLNELVRFDLAVVVPILWFRYGEALEIVWRRTRNGVLIQRIVIIEFEHRSYPWHCPLLLLSKSHSSLFFSFFANFELWICTRLKVSSFPLLKISTLLRLKNLNEGLTDYGRLIIRWFRLDLCDLKIWDILCVFLSINVFQSFVSLVGVGK